MAASEHLLVVLPGITGSALTKNGKEVWGLSAGSILKGIWTGGESIESLALGVDQGLDLGDGVEVKDMIDTLHIIPGLWKIDGYTALQRMLRKRFATSGDANYLPFPYDWRRDNAITAETLKTAIDDKLSTWRTQSKDAKVILVAHSMGGLVCRYYLEVLGGWKDAKALITFGTPYRGSMNAVRTLENGLKIGPLDISSTVRTFTALYQLLPTWECIELDGKRVTIDKAAPWLKNIDAARAAAALAFHRRIEDDQKKNADDDAYQRNAYTTYPVLGIKQPTLHWATLNAGVLSFGDDIDGQDQRGDGTVPRFSARPHELGSMDGMFCADKHGSIQNVEEILTHIEGIISGAQLQAVRGGVVQLAVEVDDLYAAGAGAEFAATPTEPGKALQAVIENAETSAATTHMLSPQPHTLRQVLKVDLDPGAYRIRISGDEDVQTVTDTFVVA